MDSPILVSKGENVRPLALLCLLIAIGFATAGFGFGLPPLAAGAAKVLFLCALSMFLTLIIVHICFRRDTE